MLFLKALLGFAGAGVGVMAPIAVNRLSKVLPAETRKAVSDYVNNTSFVKEVKKQVAENKKNTKIKDALGDLNNKKCKLIRNPENLNNNFGGLHACKEGVNSKTDFYYLSSEDSFNTEDKLVRAKKVLSVNYLEEGQDQKIAKLVLTLEDNKEKEVKLNVTAKSGWQYFKNVNIGDKCKLETKLLGGDDLRCELQDPEKNNATFFYNFSVF